MKLSARRVSGIAGASVRQVRPWGALFAVLVVSLLFFFVPTAGASPLYRGTVSGSWSSPVLAGVVLDGLTRAPEFPSDNTTSAVCSLSGCPTTILGGPASEVVWGDGVPSQLIFSGASFSAAPGQPFDMGTITFFNGSNLLQSLIFGADLTLTFNLTLGTAVTPEIIHVGMVSTANDGSGQANADFLTFAPLTPHDLSVFESGAATAHLIGEIIGDPYALLLDIVLDPNSIDTGFISSGPTGSPLPEPSTTVILGLGLATLVAFGRRAAAPQNEHT